MLRLRPPDWINIAAFCWFLVLAWFRGRNLGWFKRAKISAIGLGGIAITLFVAVALPGIAGDRVATEVWRWISYLLMLMFYWQGGQFVTRADTAFEARLEGIDLRLVKPLLEWCAARRAGRWLLSYLELSYLLCYVSMPLGLATMYLWHLQGRADRFWTVVLLATYPCYALLGVLQTRPPRSIGEKWSGPLLSGKIRAFNLFILRHASIHANTFPSAHVASTAACSLVLLELGPTAVGLGFLWIAISIAMGAVAGRYHYAADGILGFALAIAALGIDRAIAG